jgi:hypothetical protein
MNLAFLGDALDHWKALETGRSIWLGVKEEARRVPRNRLNSRMKSWASRRKAFLAILRLRDRSTADGSARIMKITGAMLIGSPKIRMRAQWSSSVQRPETDICKEYREPRAKINNVFLSLPPNRSCSGRPGILTVSIKRPDLS